MGNRWISLDFNCCQASSFLFSLLLVPLWGDAGVKVRCRARHLIKTQKHKHTAHVQEFVQLSPYQAHRDETDICPLICLIDNIDKLLCCSLMQVQKEHMIFLWDSVRVDLLPLASNTPASSWDQVHFLFLQMRSNWDSFRQEAAVRNNTRNSRWPIITMIPLVSAVGQRQVGPEPDWNISWSGPIRSASDVFTC